MPLHEWTDQPGWEGMHHVWMTEIARSVRGQLPIGYRAIIGSSPFVVIGPSAVKPDVAVTNGTHPATHLQVVREPDWEAPVAMLEEEATVQIEKDGRLVAAIELISPRNKDRPASREQYTRRYISYLRAGVHLLLIDVHRRPIEFGFSQIIADTLQADLPRRAAPCALSYRVGATAAFGGRMLALWHQPLIVGEPLPAMELAITLDYAIRVDLDSTYTRAAIDNYLE